MGNGSSQSIVLGPPRLKEHSPLRNGYPYHMGVPNYIHPQNRVLPKPVVGQRLRTTDNGSILQTVGTIRGQKRDSNGEMEDADSEVLGILRRRSEMIERENNSYQNFNLRNHRLFHSDPDIARTRPTTYSNQDVIDGYNQRRSCGGAAVRASKLKYKKKARAPEPPSHDNSPPRFMGRNYELSNGITGQRNQKNLPCKCIPNKTKAPQPPAIVIHPPPPPPLPAVTTRTKAGVPSTKPQAQEDRRCNSSSVTRAVECNESRSNYEKNVHPLDKWRNCRSMGDVRIDEGEDSRPGSRTTVFDSKNIADASHKKPSYLPQCPDPFQKEIQAVTKQIAKIKQQDDTEASPRNECNDPQNTNLGNLRELKQSSPKQYFFCDANAFKLKTNDQKLDIIITAAGEKQPIKKLDQVSDLKKDISSNNTDDRQLSVKPKNCTSVDEIVPSLQRFSPGRQRLKSPNRSLTAKQKAETEWENLSRSLYHKQDEESDIDIRLRPVLPRKAPEIPKFSALEAWQALGSDGLGTSSNQSTSDDGHESRNRYKKGSHVRNTMNDINARISETSHRLYDKAEKHRSMSDSHWTPRQDLLDDSDVSSVDSEDAVVPRIRPNTGEIATRFSLPTVMFSNMRPIGSELRSSKGQLCPYDNVKTKQARKRAVKRIEPFAENESSNFRRFLSKRNKYLSEEDIAVSDSNWTFGQQGLHKRGKQYSSELILSDKKKHELMKTNFGDFLGDILVTKSNHMRNQMKSSDSGNSNFSFYSTEGHVMYSPDKGGFMKNNDYPLNVHSRVRDLKWKFDSPNQQQRPNYMGKNKKKVTEVDLERKRDLELVRMLEDDVRKRRNKEKISIRQQLQRIKSLHADNEDDEFDDEAYFTEPKSREDTQSPFIMQGLSKHYVPSDLRLKYSHISPNSFLPGALVTTSDSAHLSHWQSSPAILEDSIMQKALRPICKGQFSSSSVMSSPDPETWQPPNAMVDTWLRRQQYVIEETRKKNHEEALPPIERSSSDDSKFHMARSGNLNENTKSSYPPQRKERRKTNIYKQLMDIVRKEEKHLKNAQKDNCDPNSRESSYSQRESSESTCSKSSSSSSYSYSDSSSSRNHSKNGIPANNEFHTSGYTNSNQNGPLLEKTTVPPSSFQVAFVQPYSPKKTYRPVPFDVAPSSSGFRMPGLQESQRLQAEAS